MKELESERLSLHGEAPQGLLFAEGYPDEQTLEVMDLLAGERSRETTTGGIALWVKQSYLEPSRGSSIPRRPSEALT